MIRTKRVIGDLSKDDLIAFNCRCGELNIAGCAHQLKWVCKDGTASASGECRKCGEAHVFSRPIRTKRTYSRKTGVAFDRRRNKHLDPYSKTLIKLIEEYVAAAKGGKA